jgi:hypothetical protein
MTLDHYPLHKYTRSNDCWSSVLRSNGSDLYFSSALPLDTGHLSNKHRVFRIGDPTTIVAAPPDLMLPPELEEFLSVKGLDL